MSIPDHKLVSCRVLRCFSCSYNDDPLQDIYIWIKVIISKLPNKEAYTKVRSIRLSNHNWNVNYFMNAGSIKIDMVGVRLLECSKRYYILRHQLRCRSMLKIIPISDDFFTQRHYHDLASSKGKTISHCHIIKSCI